MACTRLSGSGRYELGKYFGTDGFRGRANETLTAIHAFRVGRFLGKFFSHGRRARLLVGKDTRLSSYMFEYALTAGATASGADVYLLHVTTTPSVSYLTRTEGFDCGVMISASHNRYTDNGIKLFNGNGEKLEEHILRRVEEYIDGGSIPLATGNEIGRTVDFVAGRNRYLAYLLTLSRASFRGMRVGLDCANGSAWQISKAVFDALGARVYAIGAEPDGTNINENCGSTHISALRALVTERDLDVGFAFDGDADRCICVDERGDVVDGDGILYLSARAMKNCGELENNGIVATVMSNSGLENSLGREGIEVVRCEVGDKWVHDALVSGGYMLGGEQSGHIIFRKVSATGDGILTALKVMETMIQGKCPLSCLVEGFQRVPQHVKNVRVDRKEEILNSESVAEALDAARGHLSDGRLLLRASGTEPVLRILAEGYDEEGCNAAISDLEHAILHAGEVL